MNKKAKMFILIITAFIVSGITGWYLYSNQNQSIPVGQTDTSKDTPVSTNTPIVNEFNASFEIVTNGTRRIFTAAMYHNQSSEVFIQNPDPSIIYVKKEGITWTDFFKTLPFSLTKTCLVTGTKETFCNDGNKKLMFFLNSLEMPDALDLKIQPGDVLRVVYGD